MSGQSKFATVLATSLLSKKRELLLKPTVTQFLMLNYLQTITPITHHYFSTQIEMAHRIWDNSSLWSIRWTCLWSTIHGTSLVRAPPSHSQLECTKPHLKVCSEELLLTISTCRMCGSLPRTWRKCWCSNQWKPTIWRWLRLVRRSGSRRCSRTWWPKMKLSIKRRMARKTSLSRKLYRSTSRELILNEHQYTIS
mgnify:CR=1 FL=1